jgi:hypothetical protein
MSQHMTMWYAVMTQPPVEKRGNHDYVVDETLRLCFVAPTPMKAWEQENGTDHLSSGSCADLIEAKNSAVHIHANGLQRLTNDQEMFGRYFPTGPPIGDSGRSYAGYAGCLGRSTEGVYDIVD